MPTIQVAVAPGAVHLHPVPVAACGFRGTETSVGMTGVDHVAEMAPGLFPAFLDSVGISVAPGDVLPRASILITACALLTDNDQRIADVFAFLSVRLPSMHQQDHIHAIGGVQRTRQVKEGRLRQGNRVFSSVICLVVTGPSRRANVQP